MKLDTVRAGIFVATGILGATAITILLSKTALFSTMETYTVVFQVADGVTGLIPGSEVRVGGLKRGQVVSVQPISDPQGIMNHIDVKISLDHSIPLYPGARVIRLAPLIGSGAWLDFRSLGSGGERLPPGSHIDAGSGGGALAAVLGPDASANANQVIENLARFSEWLATVPADYKATVLPTLDNLNTLTTKANKDYDGWSQKVTLALDSTASGTAKFDSGMTSVNDMLAEDLPKLDATLDNSLKASEDLSAILTRARSEGMDSLMLLLKHGNEGLDSFASSIDLIHNELVRRIPDLDMTIEDIRTSVGQLKLAALEIRRSPWKLLYTPTTDEVAHENLYGAARSFAMASQDLRAAGDSLREVLSRQGDRFANDPEFRRAIQEQLLGAIKRYEAAERGLADVLLATPPGGEGAAAPAPKDN